MSSEGSAYGYPLDSAYDHDGAGSIPCPTCGAAPMEVCEDRGQIRKIPHTKRLGNAYRANNPEGIRRYEEREAHLKHHRATFKAPWLGK